MMAERWQQVKEVLYAALEQDPGERAAFLDKACGEDQKLRREAEALIASHEHAGSFLEDSVLGILAEMVAEEQNGALVGQTLDQYTVLSVLGTGGMGDVYLAADARLGRKVALKLLPACFTQDEKRLHRFQREARTTSAFNHPNILTIHEIREVDGLHFIATEFIEGETLGRKMKAHKMGVGEALDAAIQVANALVTAHAAGIIHRDIKPENIMVRTDGIVKVLDFGLAKLTEQRDSDSMEVPAGVGPAGRPLQPGGFPSEIPNPSCSGTGMIIGTAKYMSPEQARGLEIDARSDLWSLGVVLYEMTAGRAPYEGKTSSEIVLSILEGVPPPLEDLAQGLPPELGRIVGRCLERDREHRYQSSKDLLDDLKNLRRKIEAVAAGEADDEKRQRSGMRYRLAAIALSVVLLAAALVYALLIRGSPPVPGPQIESLAVLPLQNGSGDPAQDLFTDGITGALINDLARIGALRVISNTSVMRFKSRQKSLPQIAQELNVEAVVDGTLLRSGDRVRVAAKLVYVPTGMQLWAGSYERYAHDIQALHQEVARAIAGEIRVELTPQEQVRLTNARSVNAQAFDAYLEGRSYLDKRNEKSLQTAIGYFQRAIALDAGYALPRVGLSDAYFALGTVNVGALPPAEALQKGAAAALEAIALDDTLAEAHTALGVTKLYSWKWSEAEREFNHALELNPNYAPAHSWHAIYLVAQGRIGEAIARIYRAREVDPLSPHIVQNVGWVLSYARQHDEAIEQFQQALRLDPGFLFARLRLAGARVSQGRFGEAIAEYEGVIEIAGRSPAALAGLGSAYAAAGRRKEARQILGELTSLQGQRYVNSFSIADAHLGLGEKEQGLRWLEIAYQERSYGLVFLKVGKQFDILRSDPRFQDLLRRMELSP